MQHLIGAALRCAEPISLNSNWFILMPEHDKHTLLQDRLQRLVGLPLSIARDAADMKIFHFGTIRPHHSGSGSVGAYALHLQCPWRIVTEHAVVTGTSDRFVEAGEGAESCDADPQSGSLQGVRLAALLKAYDTSTKSFINATDHLVVASVSSDGYGGADIALSGGYRLQIFPDGSREENWRFIEVEGWHIVIEAGQVLAAE
jgi:hypothetical protein